MAPGIIWTFQSDSQCPVDDFGFGIILKVHFQPKILCFRGCIEKEEIELFETDESQISTVQYCFLHSKTGNGIISSVKLTQKCQNPYYKKSSKVFKSTFYFRQKTSSSSRKFHSDTWKTNIFLLSLSVSDLLLVMVAVPTQLLHYFSVQVFSMQYEYF